MDSTAAAIAHAEAEYAKWLLKGVSVLLKPPGQQKGGRRRNRSNARKTKRKTARRGRDRSYRRVRR